jgi:hypothetical protein
MSVGTAVEKVGVAIAELRGARALCAAQPGLVTEIDWVLTRLGMINRALMKRNGATAPPHAVVFVALPNGIAAHCVCSWESPVHGGVSPEGRSVAWRCAREDAAEHLKTHR